MNKRTRTQGELEELLQEQIQFLESSAEAFDKGFEGEAKRLAVTIRVLLHDTKNSHSLLSQLGKKDISLWDTALPNDPDNELPHGGLIYIAKIGKETKYFPMLDDVLKMQPIPFEDWWKASVFMDDQKATLSRRDLILTAADQDGGAHVDPKLNETYARLGKENSLGWIARDPEGPKPVLGPERAAIRQVAHEVIKSLKPGYEKKGKHNADLMIAGATLKFLESPPIPTGRQHPFGRKVGRNEKCPCGSGEKYKNCHGKVK